MVGNTVPLDQLMDPQEVADLFGVTKGYLATRRFEGKGRAFVKIGAAVRYRAGDVAAWLAANTHNLTEGAA